MKKYIALVLCFLTACGGGGGSGSTTSGTSSLCNAFRVLNGAECANDALPIVNLIINDQFQCTGTVITNDEVLTAAHCAEGATQSAVALHDHGQQSATNRVANPLFHTLGPKFDIGLLKFPGIATNLGINPAHIGLSTNFGVGSVIKVVGYGRDGTDALANGNPRAVELTISTVNNGGLFSFFDANNSGTCFGDSGAAATINGLIVGTVEGGSANCAAGNYNSFTDMQVTGNVDFIRQYAPATIFE